MSQKKAWYLSFFWIGLALLFNVWIYVVKGEEFGLQFFTAYLVEKSLSVDNLIVFLYIFMHYRVSSKEQYKILYLGVWGAMLFRILFIFLGLEMLEHFRFAGYLLGGLLCATAVRMLFEFGAEKRVFRKRSPLAILLMVEGADVLFALDSIPAVLAVSTAPFIAYTSNLFAVLGLRALYFALAPFLERLQYIQYSLVAILLFMGVKFLGATLFSIPLSISLIVILSLLAIGTFFSIRK
jgi:tellurite resistance protein TerC